MFDLLMECTDLNNRLKIAEYINSHPDEFKDFLSHVFDKDEPESHTMREKVFDIVDLIIDKLAISAIEMAIRDSDSQVRINGLKAAYRTRIDLLNAEILQVALNQNEIFEVRKWSLHILGSTDSKQFGRIIRGLARDNSEEIDLRKEAIYALTRINDDEMIGALCALLGDPNVEIRQAGAWALSNIAAPESITCLFAALEDDNDEVRDWAIRGLRDMDDSRALQGLANCLRTSPPEEQVRMIRLVIEKKSEILLRAIAELLVSPETTVRCIAAWAMGVSLYPPAMGSLEILLEDTDEQVRKYAKMALVRMGRIDLLDSEI